MGSDDRRKRDEELLGRGLSPGADHYRAYVGPPEDYDLIAAMTFGLLTTLGLRQHHRLLDVGCGSLRVGRLLIPYLNRSGYTGIEPNDWLIEEGIRNECGKELVEIKAPRFILGDDPSLLATSSPFDLALAQSIFSHAGLDQISAWTSALSKLLQPTGALVATFVEADADHAESGWFYPECVGYRRSTMQQIAEENGFRFRILDWSHPRQTWAIFAREEHPIDWIDSQGLSWNASLRAGRWT